MAEEGQGGGANSSERQQAGEVGSAGTGGRGGGRDPVFYPTGSKVKHHPPGPLPQAARAWSRATALIPFHLPPRRNQGCPRVGALPLSCAAGDARPENMAENPRCARERFGEGCARRPAPQLGEVGGGELERLGWRQVQRVPAAPRRGSFLPPALSFLPFPPPSRLPGSLPSSSVPSLLPATPTLVPALLLPSLPSQGAKPARPRLPAGPPWPQGPPRSLPESRRALSRRPPHPRASERPQRQLLLLWGPQAEAVPWRPQPARAAASSMCAIHTQGPLLGPW